MKTMTLDDLISCDLPSLEALYVAAPDLRLPTSGSFRGTYLRRLQNPGANDRFNHVLQWALFDLMPFGLNFHPGWGDWYFFHPKISAGRFVPRQERSRWRNTDTNTLNYEKSRLPRPARALLYDELKPLSERLMLGFGGTNAETDKGDHFFFALTPM